jgi:putative glutamine amidotransferase
MTDTGNSKRKIAIAWEGCQVSNTFNAYANWVLRLGQVMNPNIEAIEFCYRTSDPAKLKDCDALILAGGRDIHPHVFGSQRLNYPNQPSNWDAKRDEFEIKVVEIAKQNQMPLLAICRGMQLVNCIQGGTLHHDLEESGFHCHRKIALGNDQYQDREHKITVSSESDLIQDLGDAVNMVNSAHHQAIDRLGNGLKVTSISDDAVIESLEWSDQLPQWFRAVQWHPERMSHAHPWSKNLLHSFLKAVKT